MRKTSPSRRFFSSAEKLEFFSELQSFHFPLAIRVARWRTYFQTKNRNSGQFLRALQWYLHFMDSWSIWLPFDIFLGYLVYIFCGNLVYFPCIGILFQEKSGNPVCNDRPKVMTEGQGDQIGRIFAQWVIAYIHWVVSWKFQKWPSFFATFFNV
jgi:hypothetical protein